MLSMSMPHTDNAMAALLGASATAFSSIWGTPAGTVVRQRKTARFGNVRPLSLLDGPPG